MKQIIYHILILLLLSDMIEAQVSKSIIIEKNQYSPNSIKRIEVVYFEKSQPIPNKNIFLNFYDQKESKSIILKQSSDSSGKAVFYIPEYENGVSAVFRIDKSVDNFNKIQAIRIPAKMVIGEGKVFGGEDSLKITFDNKGKYSNEGAIQLWTFPK